MGYETAMEKLKILEKELKELRSFKTKAQAYAQKFVNKVESGKARSKETYADMQNLLKS